MKLKDVKFLKMSRSDYENQVVTGEPIQNFPEWLKMDYHWVSGDFCSPVSRANFAKGCFICGDNRARFKEHFGKCAFTFKGEHYYHGWLADLGTAQVIVLTAKGKGTCYEVVNERDGEKVLGDIHRVLEFVDMISELTEERK